MTRLRVTLPAATLALAIVLAITPAAAATIYVTPDVPADLSGTTYKASDIALGADATYSLALALPANARLDALQRLSTGQWLVSFEAPTRLGTTEYDPRDVVRTDGTTYTLYWSGAANGIPAGVNVDAIALAGSDTAPLLLSVDVPAQIGGLNVRPGDVLKWSAGVYTKSFDATAAGVPEGVNTVGLDALGANGLLLSFDVPVDLGTLRALPGDVVSWNGLGFSMFRKGSLNGWSVKHEIAGLALPAAPGHAQNLRVAKAGPGNLSLSWDASCSSWTTDYGIYAGTLGNFTSHRAIDCADAGHDNTEVVTPPAGNTYFLVVPLTAAEEGSYGQDSSGHERPRGTVTCRATQGPPICP